MLSESDIEAAHPDAFDFVWGNLPSAKRAEFDRHLGSCHYCQAVVDEYSEIGRIIKLLPPHVEPSAELQDRTVTAMTAARAGQGAEADQQADDQDRAATRVYQRAEAGQPGAAQDRGTTQVYQVPQRRPSPVPETQIQPRPKLRAPATGSTERRPSPVDQPAAVEPEARAEVIRLPVWRRYRGRLGAIAAVAAVVIVAVIVASASLGQGPAGVTVAIKLHATAAAKTFGVGTATAQATARQADQSWTFTFSVHGLKPLPDNDFYECWWVTPGHTRLLATGGSFLVGNSGSTTVTMTTGVDPTQQFTTMEITAETPGKDGGLNGPVLLIS